MNMDDIRWNATWTIDIREVVTQLRVGIWEHEREYQPVVINLTLRGDAPIFPATIDDCLDYEPICRWLLDELPQRPYTQLLETKLTEVMDFVFAHDPRIAWVELGLSKPKAIAGVGGAGVRMALSRADYMATVGSGARQSRSCAAA